MSFEIRSEIREWCEANTKGVWRPITDYQALAPSKFSYKDETKDIDLSFTMMMMLTQPAIEFEDENDLIHFKLRWFG